LSIKKLVKKWLGDDLLAKKDGQLKMVVKQSDEIVCDDHDKDVPLEASALGIELEHNQKQQQQQQPAISKNVESAEDFVDFLSTLAESTSLAEHNSSSSSHNVEKWLQESPNVPIIISSDKSTAAAPNNQTNGQSFPLAICCFINHILCDRYGGEINWKSFAVMLKILSPTSLCILLVVANIAILSLFIYHYVHEK